MFVLIANKILKLFLKIFPKKDRFFVAKVSDEDAIRNINYLAHQMRRTKKGGAGVPLFPISFAIDQGYKTIRLKEKQGVELFGFEKWIKENYRLLRGRFNDVRKTEFSALPHVEGVPRIIVLADYVVKCSGGRLDNRQLENIVRAFNQITPLTFIELESLQSAIAYRLLWEVSILAEKVAAYYSSFRAAKKRGICKRFIEQDSYLFYYYVLHKENNGNEYEYADRRLAFENVIAANETLVASFVESLRNLPLIVPFEACVRWSKVNDLYMSNEAYRSMSDAARKDYLLETYLLASKWDSQELSVARSALELEKEHKVHFGRILYKQPEALRAYLKTKRILPLRNEVKKVQGVYCTIVLLCSLFIAAFPAYYLRNMAAYFCVLPLFIASLHPVEYLLKRIVSLRKRRKPLPEMEYEMLPEKSSTVVVVSRFISEEKDVDEALEQIESLAVSYPDPNMCYAVVADLPPSETEVSEQDKKLLDYISGKKLSSSVGFYLRKRVFRKGKWVAYERKRGALLSFLKAVEMKTFDEFYCYGNRCKGYFAVLLDDDSELLPGTLKSAVFAMSHPLNEEYDLMSFGGKVNRYSLETYYSQKYSRACSIDAYPYYSDFYSDRFDCALYCGKAIVRISSYVEKLTDFFPDDRILSHDIIEGAVLRSRSLKRCVYEDAPKTFSSDYARTTRWQRGDVQLLPYAFLNRVRIRDGSRRKNPIEAIYKLVIFINGLSVLADISIFLSVVAGLITSSFFLVNYSLSVLLGIYAFALINEGKLLFARLRFRHAFVCLCYSLRNLAEQLFLLPVRAIGGLYIFVISLWKMAIGSNNLLSWTPFRVTQEENGYSGGAKIMLPALIVSTAISFFIDNELLWIYTFFSGVYMLAVLFLGKKIERKGLSEDEKGILRNAAQKIYAYFTLDRSGGLITDNIQLFPNRTTANMTSPTNIGFSILSEISADILGLTDSTRALTNIESTLSLIEKMQKWNGHLFNWYNVSTLEPMEPKVVSTVDSANLIACLIVAKSYAKEKDCEPLYRRLSVIIDQTDFTPLIDKNDHLLSIVYNVSDHTCHGKYDLLASEARLAYLIAVSKGADPKGYFSLGREFTRMHGNTLLSWSGTAFEYMLPRLFVKSPRGSLMYEQEYRSALAQAKNKTDGVFGRSECGYGVFNNSTAYLYKAVGTSSLAMSGECADVVAPYATFLYLPCIPKLCLSNLKRLTMLGAEGEYGYFEAIDFDKEGTIVRSYMSHHQGMSLAAIANALSNDEIVRLFSSDDAIRSVRLLNAEENEYRKFDKNELFSYCVPSQKKEFVFSLHEPAEVFVDKSEEYIFVRDTLGRGYSELGGVRINRYLDYKKNKGGLFFQIKENGIVYSPTFYPSGDTSCCATIYENGIRYMNPSAGISSEAYLLHGYNGEMHKLTISNDLDVTRNLEVSCYVEMTLNRQEAYDSHPSFSDMFVHGEYDEKTKSAVLYRRGGDCKVTIGSLFSFKGVNEVRYNCNRYNVYGRTEDCHDDYALGVDRQDEPPFGDVLYPCFAACGTVEVPPHSEISVYCYILAATDLDSLCIYSDRLDSAYKAGILDLLGRSTDPVKCDPGLSAFIGGRLLNGYPSQKSLKSLFEDDEIRSVLSEGEKLVYFTSYDESESEIFSFAAVLKHLSEFGLKNRAVFAGLGKRGDEQYNRISQRIHALDPKAILLSKDDERYKSCAFFVYGESADDKVSAEKDSTVELCAEMHSTLPPTFETGEGYFCGGGYHVRPFGKNTMLPYANVIGGEAGGFVITERGGGFSFGKNAREEKLSIWNGDAVEDFIAERFYLETSTRRYLLNGNNCIHKIGMTSFEANIEGRSILLNVYPIQKGASKVYEVIINGEPFKNITISFEIFAALNWRFSDDVLAEEKNGLICFRNVRNGQKCFLQSSLALSLIFPLVKGSPFTVYNCLKNAHGAYRIILSEEKTASMDEKEIVLSKAETLKDMCQNSIRIESGIPSLDLLYNECLPYQVQSARLLAKSGFYQCSGATGFRDQLQDVLALLISDPMRVRKQILSAAAHQYEEGDVQHWWHEPHIGVRTRISDDRMWLPYIAAKYLSVTEDYELLKEEIPYLRSECLQKEEISRYEIPAVSYRGTITDHIYRAIMRTLDFGEHGLLKIGSGDWNDGLDRVGVKGRGESVWLTMFAYQTIDECLKMFSKEVMNDLSVHLNKMRTALRSLIKDGRYPLCFTDEGTWLGYADTPDCTLSLNPQTWSVLCGAIPKEEALLALSTAKELYDENYGIVRLSIPPFDDRTNYGYISAYPRGVRENGGQYTHAAIWYLKALWETGQGDAAYEVLKRINPLSKCEKESESRIYKGEPYVLAGDVYGVSPYLGRCGWSWYTGSAGWLKYTLTEDFLGLKKRGEKMYIKPCFPSLFQHLTCKVKIGKKEIMINYQRGARKSILIDKERVEYVDLDRVHEGAEILCYFN